MLRLALWLCLAVSLFAQNGFYLKSGDRVVFYGDSITDQRLYTTFVESFVVTRFPALPVTFIHSGWGGDRVTGGAGGPVDVRLPRDVFAYKPTVMTIMLGMNDGRYRAFDEDIFKTYADGMKSIVETVKGTVPGIRITAIRPSPYDDVTRPPMFTGGYNKVLIRYGDYVETLAKEQSIDVADLNASVVAALEKAKTLDPEGAANLIKDRVHPGPAGHLLMAAALLKAWKAPATVSLVQIDGAASEKPAVKAENARVTDVAPLKWTQTDEALPMPLDMKDAAIQLALRSSDFMETLDRQLLRVRGLTADRYALKIDDEEIGVFSKDELAKGINLATLPTPMLKQAMEVHAFTLKHTSVHNARWRQIQVPLEKDALVAMKTTLAAMDELDNELIARQRAAAQPRARRYELVAR
jgi:lysophospholipase L1-like esterase